MVMFIILVCTCHINHCNLYSISITEKKIVDLQLSALLKGKVQNPPFDTVSRFPRHD